MKNEKAKKLMKVLNFLSRILETNVVWFECYCSAGNGKWNVISELKQIEVEKRLLIKEVVTVFWKKEKISVKIRKHKRL